MNKTRQTKRNDGSKQSTLKITKIVSKRMKTVKPKQSKTAKSKRTKSMRQSSSSKQDNVYNHTTTQKTKLIEILSTLRDNTNATLNEINKSSTQNINSILTTNIRLITKNQYNISNFSKQICNDYIKKSIIKTHIPKNILQNDRADIHTYSAIIKDIVININTIISKIEEIIEQNNDVDTRTLKELYDKYTSIVQTMTLIYNSCVFDELNKLHVSKK
jgi:hypothetical protein